MLYSLCKNDSVFEVRTVPLSQLADAGWTEKDLENVLAARIQDLLREDQLMPVAQERKRQEEADILALDEKGVLYIFEIKRWQSDASNLLQVIRYGQIFGQYSYENIEALFRMYVKDATADLAARHKEHFELESELRHDEFNGDQRFVVVTAGVDLKTQEAIRYWKGKGLPIESITYHVYKHANEYLIEFNAYSPSHDEYAGLLTGNFIVNTNATFMPTAYREMLDEGKAAAYYDRKSSVDGIQKGDRVFLYHTRVGIIAVGRASSHAQVADCGNDKGEQHFVPVPFRIKADPTTESRKCVPPWEINQHMGTSLRFRQTAFSITREMGDKIEELLAGRMSVKGMA